LRYIFNGPELLLLLLLLLFFFALLERDGWEAAETRDSRLRLLQKVNDVIITPFFLDVTFR